MQIPPHVVKKFWLRVDKTNPSGCWIWTAAVSGTTGYGAINLGARVVSAHRVSWILAHGQIQDGLSVLHNCPNGDNRLCVNPAHLWVGTQKDNVDDCIKKGRKITRRGEESGRAKLTSAQVLEIRKLSDSINTPTLAKMFNIGDRMIRHIVTRQSWTHI